MSDLSEIDDYGLASDDVSLVYTCKGSTVFSVGRGQTQPNIYIFVHVHLIFLHYFFFLVTSKIVVLSLNCFYIIELG